jgi:Protein of unknown function (DUF2656)
MLLSHNFDLSTDIVPTLSRAEFFEVFQSGLSAYQTIHCRLINHPHWTLEIRFAVPEFSAAQIGELCATALAEARLPQLRSETKPAILILGGLKTTPPTPQPDALQPGEWGVDVVETLSSDSFLQGIGWDATVAQKPPDTIFKVVRKDS